ncbi:MAG: 50S ribosomal protein L11 methyltransferase [Cyclobacteriaceae bacterium]|nr:50S ribosomal protein L11 methyltransferase [Cyclobacteriaceae bacterium]MCH8514720.1 50S ribosomal protein L11 methyltransferase [Cyclobacteriaceae bacterium]
MDYKVVAIKCSEETAEILSAELSYVGFDSFAFENDELTASVASEGFDREGVLEILDRYTISEFDISDQKKVNWNEEWEKNYDPIAVEDLCYIRADFHSKPDRNFKQELIITPKMSFGTGHHHTTWQMTRELFALHPFPAKVMDAGTGTGILALLAEKLGAKEVLAFDIEDWSVENTLENATANNCTKVKAEVGTIKDFLEVQAYDAVLANINKNVLLNEISLYAKVLKNKGILLLSGFYDYDEKDIMGAAKKAGFEKVRSTTREGWMMLHLQLT